MSKNYTGLLYGDVIEADKKLFEMFSEYSDRDKGWELFYQAYIDPDKYPISSDESIESNSVECSADGLISIKRIKNHEGFHKSFISTFVRCRRKPIFSFPREKGGINSLRMFKLGDRIDHTLYDLKRKCNGETDCKLESAYEKELTKKWLESLEYKFENIVNLFKLDEIFVQKKNEEYQIFDLEEKDGSYICKYRNSYPYKWKEDYYKNLINKINKWMERNGNS